MAEKRVQTRLAANLAAKYHGAKIPLLNRADGLAAMSVP